LPKLITPKIIIIIVIAIYSGITIARNFDWKDRVTLFTKDIENVSNSSQAHNLLAAHLGIKANEASTPEEKKRIYELSVEHFKKSLEIYPDYLNPTFDLGRTLIVLGRYDEAIAAFENAVRIKPSYSVSYTNLGLLMDNNGNLEAAVDNYKKSIERNPRNLTVYNNLSYAYFRLEKYNESININKKAIEHFPSAYQPYVNIGKTYLIQRNLDSALVYLEQGYQYNQNDYDMTNLLYQICLSKNDTQGLFYGNRLKSLQKP
jgi:tetratricopeptide (TPR) repeat protein